MIKRSKNKITFDEVPQVVAEVSYEVSLIRNEIQEIKKSFEPKKPEEYLTRKEVAKLLSCDLSTIHNWTQKGKLKKYGLGYRTYYKRSEIEQALQSF